MATNVLFSRGSSVSFSGISKDPNTLYFLTDTHEMYLGGDKYAVGQDTQIIVTGVGDTVANAKYEAATKTLTLTLGEADQAESITEAIQEAVKACVKTVTSDAGSSIKVDDSDKENLKLSLNIASDEHAGNVKLEECSDGLKASVDIPEATVQGVAEGDSVLKLNGGELSTKLSITTVKESGTTYVVLKGQDAKEISRFDAAEFVKDGMLESVSLGYSDDGHNHRVLIMKFNTESEQEDIKIDLQDLITLYEAKEDGGLKVVNDNEFAIDNEIEESDGAINKDVAPRFGETVTLKAVKYNKHGLITGTGDFTFKLPTLDGGNVGSEGKLLKHVTLDADGTLTGETVDIATELSASSKDTEIPSAKAVYDAIEGAKTVWENI